MKMRSYILTFVCLVFAKNLTAQGCVNVAQIDSSHTCSTVLQPVCGCDGVTYKNSCEAEYYGGVTGWTPGQCLAGGCQANFTFAISTLDGRLISFNNTSNGNFDSVVWNFGDGSFSVQNNPSHHYPSAGTYTACLYIYSTNSLNCSDSICKTFLIQNADSFCIDSNLINSLTPCPAVFNPVCGCNGITYPNSCEAKYRGGVTAWTQGPCQSFGSCNASFNYTVFASAAGHTVLFNNSSTGNFDSAVWNFGDGTTSASLNPSHTYAANLQPTVVEVCLTISDSAQQCTDSYCLFINLTPIGCFDAAVIALNSPCPNIFSPVCGCDGNTYNNACVAYQHHGITSWTQGPCSATNLICKADFEVRSQGLNFHFNNTSSGTFNNCSWDFGDGATSNDCNPTHHFSQPGRYLVCLEISSSNQGCQDTFCLPVTISTPNQLCQDSALINNSPCPTSYDPVCGCNGITYSNSCVASHYAGISSWTHGPCSSSNTVSCRAFFNFTTLASSIGYEVDFSNYSVGGGSFTRWSFGDGAFSNQPNPSHTYLIPGYYLVCLTVEDQVHNCMDTYCANIRVNAGNNCIDQTVVDPTVGCPEVIDPVCGCDGKTYVNSCEAYYLNGVTYWTRGTCTHGGCQAGYDVEIDASGRGTAFTNTSLGNFSHSFWDFGDGNHSSEEHPHHIYNVLTSQVYTACLSIFDSVSNCTDSYCRNITVINLNPTGIAYPEKEDFHVKVFPNPFTFQTNIEIELAEPSLVTIEVFNALGKREEILDNKLLHPGKYLFNWMAEGNSSGIYFLRAVVNGEKYNHRLHVIR